MFMLLVCDLVDLFDFVRSSADVIVVVVVVVILTIAYIFLNCPFILCSPHDGQNRLQTSFFIRFLCFLRFLLDANVYTFPKKWHINKWIISQIFDFIYRNYYGRRRLCLFALIVLMLPLFTFQFTFIITCITQLQFMYAQGAKYTTTCAIVFNV